VTVVPTNSAYSYDLNGNLLSDGTRNFAYDDENELISVWQANGWSNNFAYDGKLRRRIARQYSWNGSSWLETNEVHYVYDGNVVVQERNGANLPQVTYTRGIDLSGQTGSALTGAGGIGGLLARTDNTRLAIADPFASAYYHCDGNGNVTCLLTPYQQLAAKYLYDPYGNLLAMSGSLAAANVYRFSSKEWDGNSGLYYYLYRFYDPNLQRWPNRDPLGEFGFEILRKHKAKGMRTRTGVAELAMGPDLYEFVHNSPISRIDLRGLDDCGCFQALSDCTSHAPDPDIGEEGDRIEMGKNVLWDLGSWATECYAKYFGCLSGCPSFQLFCPGSPPPRRPPQTPPQVGCSICPVNNPPVLPPPPPPIWFPPITTQW
jgi:RHS repeat-associated protein